MNIKALIQAQYPNRIVVEITEVSEIRQALEGRTYYAWDAYGQSWIENQGEKLGYFLGTTAPESYAGGGKLFYCSIFNYLSALDHNEAKKMEQRIAQLEADKTELFVLVGRLVKVMGTFGEGEKNPFAVPIEESIALLEKLN